MRFIAMYDVNVEFTIMLRLLR